MSQPVPTPERDESEVVHASAPHCDRTALTQALFQEHNRALVDFLAARLTSTSEALDVAQEAYVRILQLDRPETIGFLRAYLFRTAANIATDRLRQRRVRELGEPMSTVLFEQLLTAPDPERTALGEQQLALVTAALRELPDKCRRAFALHLFAERPLPAIAAELGLTVRMVRYHIARGLAHCRRALDEAAKTSRT